MNKNDYLNRIGVADPELSVAGLHRLQNAHLLNVPFENLDIYTGREITLDKGRFYEKVVGNKRGGFCYELNSMFNELLKAIGFKTRVVSALVAMPTGVFSAEFDHLTLIVGVEGREFLVDVGFGDFTAGPIEYIEGGEMEDRTGVYSFSKDDDGYVVVVKKDGDDWMPKYKFRDIERELEQFSARCVHLQTSPESPFTQGALCSILTEDGRKTLTDKKFIVTGDSEKTETDVESDEEFWKILDQEFGISRSLNR